MNLKTLLTVLAVAVIVISCSDPAPNTEAPTVSMAEIDKTITGVIDLKFQLDGNIAKAQIFIDDVLVDTKNDLGTADSVAFHWDSKTITDGSHELKIIITDVNGKSVEHLYTIATKNVLMTLFVPEDYIGVNNKLWIYISDHQGNIIDIKEGANNTTMVFNLVEGFTDSTVMINMFNYFNQDIGSVPYYSRMFTHYAEVKPADYHLSYHDLNVIEPSTLKGQVFVHITDMKEGYHGFASGYTYYTYDGSYGETPDTYHMAVYMNLETSNVLVALHNDDGTAKFKLLNDVTVGDEVTVSLNDFSDLTKTSIPTSDASYIFRMDGVSLADNVFKLHCYNEYNMYRPGGSAILAYASQDAYDWYTSYTSETVGDITNSYYSFDSQPDNTFNRSTAEVLSQSISLNKVKVSFSENKAYCMFANGFVNTPADGYTISDSRNVNMPFNMETDITLPDVPTEIITQFYPDGLVLAPFTQLNIQEDPLGNSTYQYNIVKARFNNEEVVDPQPGKFKNVAKFFKLNTNSGRLSTNVKNQSLLLPYPHNKVLEQLSVKPAGR